MAGYHLSAISRSSGTMIRPGGFILTILLGIAGAFMAMYIGQHLGWYREGHPDSDHLPIDQEEIAPTRVK